MTEKGTSHMLPSAEEMIAALRLLGHDSPRRVQVQIFEDIAGTEGATIQLPTGEGKTPIGLAILLAKAERGEGPCFYVVPNKMLADQIHRMYPNHTMVVAGRSEYECLYYTNLGLGGVSAQESACHPFKDCSHRLNLNTGRTYAEENSLPIVNPCPYYWAKYQALLAAQAGMIVVCTAAFWFTNRSLVEQWRAINPSAVLFDEAHKLAQICRGVFEYTITDYHLSRMADKFEKYESDQANILRHFVERFREMAEKRSSQQRSLLEEDEMRELLTIMRQFDASQMERIIQAAIGSDLDPVRDKSEIKNLTTLVSSIPRFVYSLQFSLPDEGRNALNYVVAFYISEDDEERELEGRGTWHRRRARYRLTVKAYYVAPLIRKTIGDADVVAMSATIGDPEIFGFESGITATGYAYPSSFYATATELVQHTRIYMPCNTPDLAWRGRREQDIRRDTTQTLRFMVDTCGQFKEAGLRVLVVVVSERERQEFLRLVRRRQPQVEVITYNQNATSRLAAQHFAAGQGDILLGTTAQYGEGVDLPGGLAPVTLVLRPGYSPPSDPESIFETRRFGQARSWALRNYRVQIEALQVRGRNVRSSSDKGVCIYFSQHFQRILFSALPNWLQPAYVRGMTLDECVADAIRLLR